jgi:hypothetical protein
MFCAKQPGMSEERYYISEYSSGERAAGLHLPALAFAHEARSERDAAGCCGRPCLLSPATWRLLRQQRQQQQLQQQQQQDGLGRSSDMSPSSGDSSLRRGFKGLMTLPQYLQLAVPVPAAQPVSAAASAAAGDVELALSAGDVAASAGAASHAASAMEEEDGAGSEHTSSWVAANAAAPAADSGDRSCA